MMDLFLSETRWSYSGDGCDAAKRVKQLLHELENAISSLILNSGRSEARLWLCKTISCIGSVPRSQQCKIFENCLTSNSRKKELCTDFLQMFFDKAPRRAGSVIAKNSHLLENFFAGNPRRISAWFYNSIGESDLEQKKGVKALFQFAFVNRDICWEELEWKGKHGQSPAVVATKPHYFLDLDIQRTVENFLEYVPEFWSSDEFRESVKGGEILSIDRKYFIDFFVDLMFKEDSTQIWNVLHEFLKEESFSSLCHHLLIGFDEEDLCRFLKLLRRYTTFKETDDFSNSSAWLETILSMCEDFDSIDQLLLLDTIINQGHGLLRFLLDEENQAERAKIKSIVLDICAASSGENSLSLKMKRLDSTNVIEVVKLLGLQSWAVHYRLSEECCNADSWESLFAKNGIRFRKSEKYTLLTYSESTEEESDLNYRATKKDKRKKKEKRRKKRRKVDREDSFDSELLDFNPSNNMEGLQSKEESWYLATDNYSTIWSSVDLPEHLSKHCFSTWMKWGFKQVK